MISNFDSEPQGSAPSGSAPIFSHKLVDRCHVVLPDVPKPMAAIAYEGEYYAYVKFFSAVEAAQRGADRLISRGNAVILTRSPKGFVLWVNEPDAKLATKS